MQQIPGKFTKDFYLQKLKENTKKLYTSESWEELNLLHEKSVIMLWSGVKIDEVTTVRSNSGEITISKKIKGFDKVQVIFSKTEKRVIIFKTGVNSHASYKNGVVEVLKLELITGEGLKFWEKWTDKKFGF